MQVLTNSVTHCVKLFVHAELLSFLMTSALNRSTSISKVKAPEI